jgi:Uma2 family endonuclease
MSVVSVPQRMRISADRYLKMAATGVLTEDDRVELIEGDIVDTPGIGPKHSAVAARLNKVFVLSAGDAAIVSPGSSIRLGKYSVPQPDLMLLKPREDFFSQQLPTATDVLLLVEISDSSLGFDLGGKRALYARRRVVEYWVVNIPGKCVHVYRDPWGERYTQAMECTLAEIVSPRALPVIQVTVGTLFT